MYHPSLCLICLLPLCLASCPDYTTYSAEHHAPFSAGRYNLSYQRPTQDCRTFSVDAVEKAITNITAQITDPDLSRLFENAFPNTLDTTVRWRGVANGTIDEELAFVITGDIDAMWLRDSANQMLTYKALLTPSTSHDSLASLFRGVINLQARNILTSPFCNAFQPPPESKLAPTANGSPGPDTKDYPAYSNKTVFECKWELDSLASFLQLSTGYYDATGDVSFFGKFSWVDAVKTALDTATAMMTTTYSANGSVLASPYVYVRDTDRPTETLYENGNGNPVQNSTGLVRCAFRPSDDATIYQFLIPANMQFSHFLKTSAQIMGQLNTSTSAELASRMTAMADSISEGISTYAVVQPPKTDAIYAYEVDGYCSAYIADDANVPSLLSAPFLGYLNATDATYVNTRALLLSQRNSYWVAGPVISAIGSPHTGVGHAWPMSAIIRSFTSSDDDEIAAQIKMVLSSTDGLGLVHESINGYNASDYTRPWFAWVNGLFGQLILELADSRPELLKRSYQ